MANEAERQDQKEDLISLVDLVAEPGASGSASPAAAPTTQPSPEAAIATVDNLLATEDPQFAQAMQDLKAQGAAQAEAAEAVVIDSLDIAALEQEGGFKNRLYIFLFRLKSKIKPIAQRLKALAQLPKTAWPAIREGAVRGLATGKDYAKFILARVKEGFTSFKALPRKSKLLIVSAIVMGALSLFALKVTLQGKFLPTLEAKFLRSFGEVAEHAWSYAEAEPFEDFADPLYHPEHVVLVEKIVVNLRSLAESSNPMGLFELYFEASNHECAVEIKDRHIEVKDLVSRSLEQLTYDDLVTPQGKEKMKVVLRKNLNAFLTRGQVRRVFFKSVVLKP